MISLAVDLAERQMVDGTASAQVISHYLKLGSSREKLEQERIGIENELSKAKIDAIASHKKIEELYGAALQAMSSYQGRPAIEMEPEFDD